MSDPAYDNAPDLPSGPGAQARNHPKFHALFKKWVEQAQLQHDLAQYQQQVNAQPGVPLSIEQSLGFMRQGDDMPQWASDFCPGHDYQDMNGEYACSQCGDRLPYDFDQTPYDARPGFDDSGV